jgi:nitrate reductase delta subunit
MKTFKALGALLLYPQRDMIAALDDIEAVLLGEGLLDADQRDELAPLLLRLRTGDLIDLQADYVHLFDRSRQISLHLYEHLYGDSRERGQAMTTLATVYRLNGMEVATNELPDFLPLVCEFLSMIELKAAKSLLADMAATLAAMQQRLEERSSPYAGVFTALLALSARAPEQAEITAVLAGMASDPESLEALDREWEEEPVTFGPGAAPCEGMATGMTGQRPSPLAQER